MKLGIENLKLVVRFAIDLGMEIDKKLEDGKITIWEGLGLIPELKALPNIIAHSEDIRNEFLDLDDSEKTELVGFVKDNFDIENDKVESIIEKSIDMITALSLLIFEIKRNNAT